MPAPTPDEIFQRAAAEGRRRLDQSLLELFSTGFIAGFTIVFGVVAQGLVKGLLAPVSAPVAEVAGAAAFALGVVFLIVGRAELFTENFFGPIATLFVAKDRHPVRPILRLWIGTYALNLVGGGLFCLVFMVDGVLSEEARKALQGSAQHIGERDVGTVLASSFVGGALVALLSFLLAGARSPGSRIIVAFMVGFLLALGTFDHVIVTALHVFLGILLGASVEMPALAVLLAVITVGNLLGGVGLVTVSHITQAEGAEEGTRE